MVHVCPDEALLLLEAWVPIGVAGKGNHRIVIVVHPFREMIGKLEPGGVGSCVFKVNDDKLLMLVCRLQKWRLLVIRTNPKNVAVLSLEKKKVSFYLPG